MEMFSFPINGILKSLKYQFSHWDVVNSFKERFAIFCLEYIVKSKILKLHKGVSHGGYYAKHE